MKTLTIKAPVGIRGVSYIAKGAIPALLLINFIFTGCAGAKKIQPHEDDVYGSRAYTYFLDGNMPLAVDTYKKGYAAARKTDHGIGASRHLSNIGRVYYEMDAIDSAVLYYKKAYDEFKSFGDSTAVSATAAFLALCFAAGGDGGQAREWLGIAASYAERKDGRYYLSVMRGLVDCLLASTGGGENSIDAAAAYYKKKKEYRMLSTIYIMKADYALSKGGYAAATAYLNEALSVIELSQEKYKRSRILLRFAAVKFNTGDKGAGKHYYERAVDCAPTGVKLQPLEVIGQKAAGGDERE